MILGVDTGGTFTDFVLLDGARLRIHKVLSTPNAPEQAILQGIDALGIRAVAATGKLVVIHGSTVATNAALEGKGVRTVFITNHGFGDMLSIGRQARAELYQLQPMLPVPPVAPELCLETGGRLSAEGEELIPLTDVDLEDLRAQVEALQPEAVAINLLYSFVDDRYERAIEESLPAGLFCSRSSEVLPEHGEYERGIATWLNASLGPLIAGYLQRLQQALAPSPIAIMQSSGGTIALEQAARRAVNLLLSGPAGGLAAAHHIGQLCGQPRLISFDMGGTSTDVALIDGDIRLGNEGQIGPWPVAVPMVDMHTIGAGGGSLAFVDKAGLLHVGPESAGASPGPACYGQGGEQATVTDANLVLGRLPANARLGGSMALDLAAAQRALGTLGDALGISMIEAASGVIRLANEHMSRALRVISIEKGYDPADFTLCCFGGAGGLHVCELAAALGMRRALIPCNGGVLSAFGMLVAPRQRQLSRTLNVPLDSACQQRINTELAQLESHGCDELLAEGVAAAGIRAQSSLDLRYQGQTFTLNIPWADCPEAAARAFHRHHELSYGHRLDHPIEVVNVRLAVAAAVEAPSLPTPVLRQAQTITSLVTGIPQPVEHIERDAMVPDRIYDGPLLITEPVATSFVEPGWQGLRDAFGNLHLSRG